MAWCSPGATDAQLWAEAGAHHSTLPAAERHGGAMSDPETEGAMRAPASVRKPSARYTGDR